MNCDLLEIFKSIGDGNVLALAIATLGCTDPRGISQSDLERATGFCRRTVGEALERAIASGVLASNPVKARVRYVPGPVLRQEEWEQKVTNVTESDHPADNDREHEVTIVAKSHQTLSAPSHNCSKKSPIESGTPVATRAGEFGTQESEFIEPPAEESKSCRKQRRRTRTKAPSSYPPEFEQVWTIYPRGDDKAGAYQAWLKIPVERRADLIHAVANLAAARAPEYCPYALRFFRGQWEDWVDGCPTAKRGNGSRPPARAAPVAETRAQQIAREKLEIVRAERRRLEAQADGTEPTGQSEMARDVGRGVGRSDGGLFPLEAIRSGLRSLR